MTIQASTFNAREAEIWVQGFLLGNSDIMADYDLALDGVLPEEIDTTPHALAEYIYTLQERITLLEDLSRDNC